MIYNSIKETIIILIQTIEKFTLSKRWKVKAVFICTTLSLVLSFPDYDVLLFNSGNQLYKDLQEGLQFQLHNPFKPIPKQYLNLANEHLDKRAFRLTVPIIASIFDFNIIGCVILQHATGILLFYLLITLFERFTEDRVTALLVSIGLACTFVGVWSFYDNLFFDGIAYFLLILAMTSTNTWAVGISVFLAAFTDERALIASSLVFIWWTIQLSEKKILCHSTFYINSKMMAVLLSWLLYFITRYGLAFLFGLHIGTGGINWHTLRENYHWMPYGILSPIEAFWWVIIAGLILLVWQRKYIFFLMFLTSIGIISVVGFLVDDISRSIGYILPAVVISVYMLSRTELKDKLRIMMLGTTFLCLIFPTTYIAIDIYWMSPILPKIIKWFIN